MGRILSLMLFQIVYLWRRQAAEIDLRFLVDGEPAYGYTRLTAASLVPKVSLDRMLLKDKLRW